MTKLDTTVAPCLSPVPVSLFRHASLSIVTALLTHLIIAFWLQRFDDGISPKHSCSHDVCAEIAIW